MELELVIHSVQATHLIHGMFALNRSHSNLYINQGIVNLIYADDDIIASKHTKLGGCVTKNVFNNLTLTKNVSLERARKAR